MSVQQIKTALESRLAAIASPLPTGMENVTFTPIDGPYQLAQFLFAPPEDPVLGDGMYRERGIFQVTLLYPFNEGAGNALAKAEAVRNWFPRGSSYDNGGVVTRIPNTPAIAHVDDVARYVQVVSIPFFADIFT